MESLHIVNAVAVAMAWVCARCFPAHRAVALTLSIGLAAEFARQVLLSWVLPPAPPSPEAARPIEGVLRWAIYLDRALFIAWPAALAGCALRVLAERRVWPVVLGYLVAAIGLAATYPLTRWNVLRSCYLAVDLAAIFLGLISLVTWLRRHWGRKRADVSVTVTAVLVTGHFASVVAGPYKFGLFGGEWYLMQLAYLILFSVMILIQGGALWEWKRSSS